MAKEKKATPALEKDWVIKDRDYYLSGGQSPLTWKIQTKHIPKKPLMWFNEETGENREIRYATNHNSIFVDEQDGHATLGHVLFTDGALHVPRQKQALQKLLSLYHPLANQLWTELDEVAVAEDALVGIEVELEAMTLVHDLELEDLEAIMRAEIGSSVTKMSSKELKRDAYLLAKNNPKLFLDLASDEDLKLRNLANRSVESGIVKLTDGNTIFRWAANNKKIMTVPFDQHPYAAFAQFFKTDEGVAVMKSVTKKLA